MAGMRDEETSSAGSCSPDTGSLVAQALAVRTPAELDSLAGALGSAGAAFDRPIGDRWGNRGMFTAAGGTFDHKLVELVTNMHDAVVYDAVERKLGPSRLSEEEFATAYPSPSNAVESLLGARTRAELADAARIELHAAGETAETRRDRTVVFRDRGVGMAPDELPSSLFRVGSSRKDGVLWQLGAFGRGSLTVLPNCYGWVVVTRKQPALLPAGATDVTSIAAVRWKKVGNRQTETAVYQVTSEWSDDGDIAFPYFAPSTGASEFEAGTHIAVVGFHAEGIWVSRLGDEKSIDTLIDTRLFDTPLPVALTTPVFESRRERTTILRGLQRRFDDNPRDDRVERHDTLPFGYDGDTFQLPIRYYLFPAGDSGARRRFVARDHALILTSNGQVHAHWGSSAFRQKTRLPKLADRVLVVVETDALPLPLRTALFTADRTELLRNVEAVRLEEELIAFLDDWDELREANNDLVRDAIRRSNGDRSTFAVAQRIGRALQAQRVATGRPPRSSTTARKPPTPRELFDDPTELIGPPESTAVRGRTKGIYFSLNARDGFVPRRAALTVGCTHLDIDPTTDVTIGELRNGRVRISIAVPPDAEPTEAEVTVSVSEWLLSNGGSGPTLSWATRLQVVETEPQPTVAPRAGSTSGGDRVAQIGLVWTTHENEQGWDANTVGVIDMIEADTLASLDEQYKDLRGVQIEIPVLRLNEEFAPLKAYSSVRARDVGDEGVARAKDRYAFGVGVQMFLLDRQVKKQRANGESVDEAWLSATSAIAARGVLAVLPDFDLLLSEVGIDGL